MAAAVVVFAVPPLWFDIAITFIVLRLVLQHHFGIGDFGVVEAYRKDG